MSFCVNLGSVCFLAHPKGVLQLLINMVLVNHGILKQSGVRVTLVKPAENGVHYQYQFISAHYEGFYGNT